MLKAVDLKIKDIYVPADRRKELDQQKIDTATDELMEGAEKRPIQVRRGKDRYVLVKGVNRLEASKALGEETIPGYVVEARQH